MNLTNFEPATILRTAADTIVERGRMRDSQSEPGQPQERSMAACVEAFNVIEGTTLSERQGWAFMQMLKLTRAAASARNDHFNVDDFVDGAAYAALAAQSARDETTSAGIAEAVYMHSAARERSRQA